MAVVCLLAFLLPASNINAGYKKNTGIYKGTWRMYDMTCPKIYRNSNGTIKLVMKVKRKGKLTGKMRFGTGTNYKVNGKIAKKKIKVHFVEFGSLFDYNGTIKNFKIKMNAFNNDSLTAKRCLTGWKQEIKAKKS